MKPIVVLEHSVEAPPGYLAAAIERADMPATILRLYAGDSLPDLDEVGAIVSLGGVMGAYEEDEFPFLADEKVFLRRAVEMDIPVLGICLGCQLLAAALGGSAYKAKRLEVEFAGLVLTEPGKMDAAVSTLATPVVTFHEDTWDAPPGATILAASSSYPGAFRYGSALAIQSHPEASTAMVTQWVEGHEKEQLLAAGVDPGEFLAAVDAGADNNEARATQLFARWLDEVRQASP